MAAAIAAGPFAATASLALFTSISPHLDFPAAADAATSLFRASNDDSFAATSGTTSASTAGGMGMPPA